MKAKDIMTVDVITTSADTPIQAIVDSMLKNRVSAIPVVDKDGRLLGIVSEGDLMNRPEAETYRSRSWWLSLLGESQKMTKDFLKTYGRTAADVMTTGVVTADEDESVASIAEKLERNRIKRVPVVRDGRIVGIVSRANLLHCVGRLEQGATASADSADRRKAIFARFAEAGIPSSAVNVIILDDVVELWGAVDSPDQVAAAELAVSSVLGSRRITNNLGIRDHRVRFAY